MPVRLAVTQSGRRVERLVDSGDVWLTGAQEIRCSLESGAKVRSIEIDPENAFPDVDRENNKWVRP